MPRKASTSPKTRRPRSGFSSETLALLDQVIEQDCTYKTIWGDVVKATRDKALRMLCAQALAAPAQTSSTPVTGVAGAESGEAPEAPVASTTTGTPDVPKALVLPQRPIPAKHLGRPRKEPTAPKAPGPPTTSAPDLTGTALDPAYMPKRQAAAGDPLPGQTSP